MNDPEVTMPPARRSLPLLPTLTLLTVAAHCR